MGTIPGTNVDGVYTSLIFNVSEQIIGALNFNKGFVLPGRFAMVETANDPFSILDVPDIDVRAKAFAGRI